MPTTNNLDIFQENEEKFKTIRMSQGCGLFKYQIKQFSQNNQSLSMYITRQKYKMVRSIDILAVVLLVLIPIASCLCPSNCNTCLVGTQSSCTSCLSDYYLQANTCKQCSNCQITANCPQCTSTQPTSNGQQSYLSVLIIVFAIFTAIAIAYVILFRCCGPKIDNQQQSPINLPVQFSQNRLNQTVPSLLWRQMEKQIDRDLTCAICLDKGAFPQTKCHHFFHLACIKAWAQRVNQCPLCKSTELNPCEVYCEKCFKQSTTTSIECDAIVSKLTVGWSQCPSCG